MLLSTEKTEPQSLMETTYTITTPMQLTQTLYQRIAVNKGAECSYNTEIYLSQNKDYQCATHTRQLSANISSTVHTPQNSIHPSLNRSLS